MYEGDDNAGVGDGGVVLVSERQVCGTRGSGSVSSAADVLWMRGMVECVRCVCVWLGVAWVERG